MALVALVVTVASAPFLDPDATRPGRDWADIHQVDALHVAEAQEAGEVTATWSFHVQGGAPLYALPTKPLSYPPFLLGVRLLGPILGMNVLLVLHAALGGAAMVLLLRRLRVGAGGALVGGLLFTGATYPGSLFVAQPFWGYALAWWPPALWCAVDVLEGRRVLRAGALLGVVLAAMAHAGGVFPLYWLACFLVPFSIPYLAARGRRPLAAAGGAVAAGLVFLGLAAVKLLPALAWMRTSGRAGPLSDAEIFAGYEDLAPHDQGSPALTVLYAMTCVGGRLGVVSLGVGAVLGLVAGLRRRLAWGAALALAALLVVALGPAHDLLRDALPFYDRMRMPYRFFFPAGVAAVLLAAILVDRAAWMLARRSRARAGAFVAAAVLLVLVDTARLPGVRLDLPAVASASERRRMAGPVIDAFDDGSLARLHFPRPTDQALWVERGLDSTTGLLGGDGSENARYDAWLPFRTKDVGRLERRHGRILDVLATRTTASYGALRSPTLRPLGGATPRRRGVDALVACLEDGRLRTLTVGGDGPDDAYGVAVAPGGVRRVVGSTASTLSSFGPGECVGRRAGPRDAYAAVILSDPEPTARTSVTGRPGEEQALDVALDGAGVQWTVGRAASERGAVDPLVLRDGRRCGGPSPVFVPVSSGPAPASYRWQGSEHVVTVGRAGVRVEQLAPPGERPRRHVVGVELVDPSPRAAVRAEGPGAAPLHLHRGRPEAHRVDVLGGRAVAIESAWPGVDVALESTVHGLALELRLEPGADPSAARLRVRGGEVEVTAERIAIRTPLDALRLEHEPGGGADASPLRLVAAPAAAGATDLAIERVGGDAGAAAATTLRLRLPLPVPSGGIGGARDEQWKAVAVGPDGAVFLAGSSASFATLAPIAGGASGAASAPDFDVVVAKFSSSGALLWTAVVGGADGDYAQGIAVDAEGRPVVIGSTRSTEATLPVRGGPSRTFAGVEDALLLRLSSDGRRIDLLGYLGGADGDYGQGVAVRSDGALVVCGDTKSDERSFPVRGGLGPTFNGVADAFAGVLSADGSEVLALGYVGGDRIDVAYALALDRDEDAWVVGVTGSSEATFPLVDPWDGAFGGGGWDGFLCEVARDGRSLLRSGFVGGAGVDSLRDVAVDETGRVWAAGGTTSTGWRAAAGDDGYEAYRQRLDQDPELRPFVRPRLYERTGARPRVALASDAVLVAGAPAVRERVVRALLERPAHDVRRTVLVEGDPDGVSVPPPPDAPWRAVVFPREGGPARLWSRNGRGLGRGAELEPIDPARVRFGPARIDVDLAGHPVAGRLLLLADVLTLHPGWRAEVDGAAAPLLRADGLATAVRLPAGARRATFRYRPPGLVAGGLVTAATAFGLLGLWIAGRLRAAARGRSS